MPLKTETALRKDISTGRYGVTMQHRHFAAIAAFVANLSGSMSPADVHLVADHFARELAGTSPNFDRDRFMRACGF